MCGGDDHLAWKRPIFLEVYRGLRIVRGSIDTSSLGSASWIRVRGGYSWPWPEDRWAIGLAGPISGWHTTEVAPPLVIVPSPISEDPHAHMERLKQRLR
ncbi:hypothetical protein CK203_035963 [Vitis vinifera]|uniref:Uncharacterized protein n=1 Tax=Vitis vinifera TaxID=29760 RepID=A0A438I070_VITVI|nr:hypothetical protein CK203_035963 [Vitis vinifera]